MRQYLRVIIPVLIPLIILMLPASAFPVEGLTVVQQRVIAIFLLAALCWVLEPIPIYATSVVIIVLELMLLSDKGLYLFRGQKASLISASYSTTAILWQPLPVRSSCCSSVVSSWQWRQPSTVLDVNLARVLLKPFGTQPKYVMFGLDADHCYLLDVHVKHGHHGHDAIHSGARYCSVWCQRPR